MERVCVLVLLLLSMATLLCGLELAERPRNTAALAEDGAQLNCSVTEPLGAEVLRWRRFDGGVTVEIYDSVNGITAAAEDDYEIEQTDELTYNLVIKSAKAELARSHMCRFELNDQEQAQAKFMVLGPVACAKEEVEGDDGGVIPLGCTVTGFHGGIKPTLEWTDAGTVIPGEIEYSGNNASLQVNLSVSAEHDLREFACSVRFEASVGDGEDPLFSDSCSTTALVSHAVTGVSFLPDPDNVVGGVLQLDVGDNITCQASGRPEPRFSWHSQAGDQVGDEAVLDIGLELEGRHTLTCRAANDFQGEEREASRDVTFQATLRTNAAVQTSSTTFPCLITLLAMSALWK